jgi:hypothetical protein
MTKALKTVCLMAVILGCAGNAPAQHDHSHDGHVHSKGMAMFSKDGGFQPYEFRTCL